VRWRCTRAHRRWLKALGIVASLALVAASGWIVVLMGSAGPAG